VAYMVKPLAKSIIELPCACASLLRVTRVVTKIYDRELKKVGLKLS